MWITLQRSWHDDMGRVLGLVGHTEVRQVADSCIERDNLLSARSSAFRAQEADLLEVPRSARAWRAHWRAGLMEGLTY